MTTEKNKTFFFLFSSSTSILSLFELSRQISKKNELIYNEKRERWKYEVLLKRIDL